MCVFSERGEKMRHSKTVKNIRNTREREAREKRKKEKYTVSEGRGGERMTKKRA